MSALNISDSEFDSAVINQKKAAIVFFWATWDGGSKASMPVFEQSANDTSKLSFYKLDVDSNTGTPSKFGVRNVPTVIVFKDGQASNKFVGSLTRTKLNDLIDKA